VRRVLRGRRLAIVSLNQRTLYGQENGTGGEGVRKVLAMERVGGFVWRGGATASMLLCGLRGGLVGCREQMKTGWLVGPRETFLTCGKKAGGEHERGRGEGRGTTMGARAGKRDTAAHKEQQSGADGGSEGNGRSSRDH